MPFSVRASLEQITLGHPAGEGRLEISIAAPAIATPDAAVPVLYVLDSDTLFGLASEIARVMSCVAGLPAPFVVGIGYGAAYADALKLRTADLTPPISADALQGMGAVGAAIGGERNGGADAFLAFLVDTLRPEIMARYPQTMDGGQMLFGHSLGGLFAAHALLTRPDAFSTFLISSPSLWWDDFALFQKLPSFKERLAGSAPPRVFVDVGGREQDLPTSVPDGLGVTLEAVQDQIRGARMVDAAREFADALGAAGVTDLRHIIFAQEDHLSVAPAAILHGLRFAFGQAG
jgi:predicted alpha/beta superfamily hydrolase